MHGDGGALCVEGLDIHEIQHSLTWTGCLHSPVSTLLSLSVSAVNE